MWPGPPLPTGIRPGRADRTGSQRVAWRQHSGVPVRFAKLDRAKTKAGDIGLIKLIVSRRGKVLGAHIIGERAGELIAEVQVMKTLNLNFGKLQKVIHPYPTYADSLRQLSQQVFLDNILKHPVVSFFRNFGKAEKQTSE